jgi:hypothetical protein
MTGFEPVPQGLEGPWATVTPHSLWFGLRVSSPCLYAGNVGCSLRTQAEHGPVRSPAHRHPSVVKDPALSSWWAARDSNPIAPRENGVTARQRTIRSYRPFGHSARIRTCRCCPNASTVSEDRTSPRPDVRFFRASGPKQKRPSRGSPQKACYSMNAGLLRRFAPRIKHAAAVAIGPGLCHEPIHTGGRSLGAGQREWPS